MKKLKQLIVAMLTAVVASCSGPTPVYAASALVSGAINKDITQDNIQKTICIPNFTKTIRPPVGYTNKLKAKQMKQFGLKGEMHDYEEDHLIPLAVGGNPTSPDNLWPQPWEGELSAHKKDRLEVRLHKLVCNGSITLKDGQRAIADDWLKAFDWYVVQKKDHTK